MILRPQEFDNGVNKWKTFSDFYFSESVRERVDVEMCLLVIDDKVDNIIKLLMRKDKMI